ncbi:alpha/beta fold hydrolase [Halomonas urumqiensis]|uniref:Alpha/beta hydrolase n=1 Tax=Halomonas urumqiensis TaxID=1684789 RepID=A0A2N7UFG4_9GAMM|nr:alpha/beta fold hydrolase [Halomonas urumqiensis]PMR79184.1 alpha/beta hydrolase [Halomonas urumqiensis]PTB03859.1 alpha/beta hydrolase [Halomonas urumqiensis]GHE19904.1 pimeloyl-[acyl-carrier protein] methyl ester esterase [Halomonas urumqiensis]
MSHLVLLSGWGIDARIWQPLGEHWPADIRVSTPDWPGYGGRKPLSDPTDMHALAEAMANDLPSDAVWVGWSLGGLLAAALLDHLPAPSALVQLGIGPRFCTPDGVDQEALDAFRRAFARDSQATLAHFRRWQLKGEPSPRHAYRQLATLVDPASPLADPATLAAGLEQLASLDVSHQLAQAPCPIVRLAGEHDPLLAPSHRDSADCRINGAGHCPMLSRPERLATLLADIARQVPGRQPSASSEASA